MPDFFRLAIANNFAWRLCTAFDGCPKIKIDCDKYQISIAGSLALGSAEMETKKHAECVIIVDCEWMQRPPLVICKEPWVTLGKADWHISDQGVMCWDYKSRWKDLISIALETGTHGGAAEFGSRWFLRSTRNLLNRHLFAFRSGIKEWRKEWDYWAHDETAEAEYLKSIAA